MKIKYEDHFERRPDVQGGKPVIKGTQVLVRDVLVVLVEVVVTVPTVVGRVTGGGMVPPGVGGEKRKAER